MHDDPVSDGADHAQPPAVLGVPVLVLDLRSRARTAAVRDRHRDHLSGDRNGQVEGAGLPAACRVADRVRAQLTDDEFGVFGADVP